MSKVCMHTTRLFWQDNIKVLDNKQDAVCRFCSPGDEFYDLQRQACFACTALALLQCPADTVKTVCTPARDAYCKKVYTIMSELAGMCGNGVHDFGEQCDSSAPVSSSALTECCVAETCKLRVGYYSDPPCSTLCGDGIKIEAEECDNFSNQNCNALTCRLR